MNKKTKYALYAGATGAIINGILNIIKQDKEEPGRPIDWLRVLKASLKGGAVCGIGGFVAGSYIDYKNGQEKPVNTDLILAALLKELRLSQYDKKYLLLCEKADWMGLP